jgi:hypothetical protein
LRRFYGMTTTYQLDEQFRRFSAGLLPATPSTS